MAITTANPNWRPAGQRDFIRCSFRPFYDLTIHITHT
jgi:hypothetical protein